MIEPFGEIVKEHYGDFQSLGFHLIYEEAHCIVLEADQVCIALTVEQYITADLQLSFVDQSGKQYPLWMLRLLLDMDAYVRDKQQLCSIKDEFGLRDGSKGCANYAVGVQCYAVTYLKQATLFLRENLSNINLEDIGLPSQTLPMGIR